MRFTLRSVRRSATLSTSTSDQTGITQPRQSSWLRNDDATKGYDDDHSRCASLQRRTPGRGHIACGTRARRDRRAGCFARGTRRAPSLSRRRLLFALYLLHAGPPSVRTCGLRADRGGEGSSPVSSDPRVTRRRRAHVDEHLSAGAAPDDRESCQGPRVGALQEQARLEHLVAALRPQPAVPSSVRKLPAARVSDVPCPPPHAAEPARLDSIPEVVSDSVPAQPKRAAVVAPIAPAQYKVQITVSADTYDKLRRAQDLLRHTIPNGDPAVIFDRALTLLLANLEKAKLAAATRPRAPRSAAPRSRHVPATIRREVWKRDGGQCAFIGRDGRCSERGFLEFHHVTPYATGGPATVENLELRCRAHDAYESEQCFGPMWVRERSGVDVWTIRTRPGTTLSDRPGPLAQAEESRRPARCGARRRSAQPERAPSDSSRRLPAL
jgi:hypothetical protein